mgnify:CR=1 FL=1
MLIKAVKGVGGPVEVAKICGVTRQAVDKWLQNGFLPRTEYTGETCYAEKLAQVSGGAFTATELLEKTAPNRTVRISASPEAG